MIEFAEAVLSEDTARLMAARQAIHDTLGADAVVDSAGVAALLIWLTYVMLDIGNMQSGFTLPQSTY